mmetsp:Transcript_73505/g.202919  ORF Transcript_73505/g.202919 Transcript_73505/m.202919 type:complete len:374 (-) Transcript_73505:218-1339(-)
MKVEALLPAVQQSHGPYCGYKPGEVIADHDLALGYVMEHYPHALPSFVGLPAKQRSSVKFTQSNMEYNMGWLVQAEAPPGALFRKFRSVITSGGADPCDVAFYFAHWLTDLAGAEPYPLEGSEKFVLKFPQKVLLSFLGSFPFVQHLDSKTETEVLEEYLDWRWRSHEPGLGVIPTGHGSIARLRLAVMAQAHCPQTLAAIEGLRKKDWDVLRSELARTGCSGQSYQREVLLTAGGPALLVYYAPALLQKNCAEETSAVGALAVLAEVLRQARSLWPLQDNAGSDTVTVRIDALKELKVEAMQRLAAGSYWALQRTSDVDGVVVKSSLVAADGSQVQVDWSKQRILSFGSSGSAAMDPQTCVATERSSVVICL